MKTYIYFILILSVLFVLTTNGQTHNLFTDILQKYVTDGLVNYKELKTDQKFWAYLDQLNNTDTSSLSEKEEIAFWINTYNAFTLKIILDNYPVKSINDIKFGDITVWDKNFIPINQNQYSLNEIENKILRIKFNEPRIHFAIVCASLSCPGLRKEAYEADQLEKQLQEQSLEFIGNKEKNTFDASNKKAYLSKIFDWFDEDFGKTEKEVLEYISGFLADNLRKDVIQNIDEWKILYKEYDWNINEIK